MVLDTALISNDEKSREEPAVKSLEIDPVK
jgi:hypothetical protein